MGFIASLFGGGGGGSKSAPAPAPAPASSGGAPKTDKAEKTTDTSKRRAAAQTNYAGNSALATTAQVARKTLLGQ